MDRIKVVIPSAREIRLDYLQPLIDEGAEFFVVDDSPGTIVIDHSSFRVFNWEDRRRMLGDLDERFPRKNGACRDFGFYLAWHESDDDDVIIALDDDCEITDSEFGRRVVATLGTLRRPKLCANGRHANVFDLYDGTPDDLFPRGFPYSERPGYRRCRFDGETEVKAEFNLGLWTDAFDVNAIDKINGPEWRHPEARLTSPSVVVPPGALISVCSMNMQFRRRVLPAAYQLPMHVEVMPGWVIDRYGDIWGGHILKTLMDLKGDALVTGEPMVAHRKAGDARRNSWQEHICHMVNDEFVELLDRAVENVSGDATYLEMMAGLSDGFASRADRSSALLRGYVKHLSLSLDAWVTALRRP